MEGEVLTVVVEGREVPIAKAGYDEVDKLFIRVQGEGTANPPKELVRGFVRTLPSASDVRRNIPADEGAGAAPDCGVRGGGLGNTLNATLGWRVGCHGRIGTI